MIVLNEFMKYTTNQDRKSERCQHITSGSWKHWGLE